MEFNEWKEAAIEGVLEKTDVFYKKGVLANFAKFTAKICARLKLQASDWNCVKKQTLTEEFSCELCEIFKNIFFTEQLWTTASRYSSKYLFYRVSTWLHASEEVHF